MARKAKESNIILHRMYWETLKGLPATDVGSIVLHLIATAEGVQSDSLKPELRLVANMMAAQMKKDFIEYEAKREQRRAAIQQRWSKEQPKTTEKKSGKSIQPNTTEYGRIQPNTNDTINNNINTNTPLKGGVLLLEGVPAENAWGVSAATLKVLNHIFGSNDTAIRTSANILSALSEEQQQQFCERHANDDDMTFRNALMTIKK